MTIVSSSKLGTDHHSGWFYIPEGYVITVKQYKQMYVFGGLLMIDGTLLVEGQVEVAA